MVIFYKKTEIKQKIGNRKRIIYEEKRENRTYLA